MYSISIQALGQHEFDLKVEGLATFLRSASFPAIASNIDITKEPSLNGLLLQYHIVNFTTGEQVGIVGYSYEDTPDSVDTGSFSTDARQAIALKTNFKKHYRFLFFANKTVASTVITLCNPAYTRTDKPVED